MYTNDEVSILFPLNFKNKSYDISMSVLSELSESQTYICRYHFENILEKVLMKKNSTIITNIEIYVHVV